jgi:hypothetical protein
MGGDHKGNENFGLGDRGDHDPWQFNFVLAIVLALSGKFLARAAAVTALDGPTAIPTRGPLGSARADEPPTLPVSPPSLIQLDPVVIRSLDLAPLAPWAALGAAELLSLGPVLELQFDWPLQADDPRERSEIPELRLWSLRADALYPWLPLVLERGGGQLARHVAMLLPHGFSASEGLRFAPESLELWITHRLFQLEAWGARHGIATRANLAQMAAVLGYELDQEFWKPLDATLIP